MKAIILSLLLIISLVFAVQPVSKTNRMDREDKDESVIKTQPAPVVKGEIESNSEAKSLKNEKQDRIEDADSNYVNDRREDDLLQIKHLKSKFKDLFKSSTKDKEERHKKPKPKK